MRDKRELKKLAGAVEHLEARLSVREREREMQRVRCAYSRLTISEHEELRELMEERKDLVKELGVLSDFVNDPLILSRFAEPARKRFEDILQIMCDESLGEAEREERERKQREQQGDDWWRPPSRRWRPRPLPRSERGSPR